LAIPYNGTIVVLQGILSILCSGTMLQLCQLSEEDLNLDTDSVIQPLDDVPSEIQGLLHEFAEVFATKISFPPPRDISHSIALIPGGQCVLGLTGTLLH
jgi:hypothetical protein